MDLSTIINAMKEKHSVPQEYLVRVPDMGERGVCQERNVGRWMADGAGVN